eukprot:309261-Chlamydomonas_euryale.AAC.2
MGTKKRVDTYQRSGGAGREEVCMGGEPKRTRWPLVEREGRRCVCVCVEPKRTRRTLVEREGSRCVWGWGNPHRLGGLWRSGKGVGVCVWGSPHRLGGLWRSRNGADTAR